MRERVICYPLFLATRDNHALRALVVAGAITLGQIDPWGNLTKGYRTRNNKRTQVFIVSRRKK